MTIHIHIHDSGPAPAAEGMAAAAIAGSTANSGGQAPMADAQDGTRAPAGAQPHGHADAISAGGPPQALVAQVEAALGARKAMAGAGPQGDRDAGAAPA